MNNIGSFLRQLLGKMNMGFQRFMAGRYGTDKLNNAILGLGLAVCIVSMLIPLAVVKLLATFISYALMFWAIFRCLSRNTYKRYQENRKYLQVLERSRDWEHRYFDCPKCHQTVRVPRGKGKIAITCPKCREKFVRKS